MKKIVFADSFFKSLKKMARHDTWYYKIWETIRYDIPRFFKNIWRFRREMYAYHAWDYNYQLMMFRRGLELEAEYLDKHGNEIESSRNKKIVKMKRAIEIIEWHEKDLFLELAEKKLGYEYDVSGFKFVEDSESGGYVMTSDNASIDEKNLALSRESRQIEKETWHELMVILEGQDYELFDKEKDWDEQFDGSGLRGWWS